MDKKVSVRFAVREDAPIIFDFIKLLAEYEKMSDLVVTNPAELEKSIFDDKRAEVIFILEDDIEVGFALFFHNFSTFLGSKGLYLEDLFVKPEYRGKGYGKRLLSELANIAIDRECGRFEWSCLDWNTPSIDFYLSLGAVPVSDFTIYRISGEKLKALANK